MVFSAGSLAFRRKGAWPRAAFSGMVLRAFLALACAAGFTGFSPFVSAAPSPETAAAAPVAANASDAATTNPYAAFLRPVPLDEFHPRAKTSGPPRRGGSLTIRTPAEFGSLNPILTNSKGDNDVTRLLFDSLIKVAPATLEYQPRLAWSWEVQDILRFKDGREALGVILERGEKSLRFAEGATRRAFALSDLAAVENDRVVLKEKWGGAELRGAILRFEHTLQIDTSRAPGAVAREIPLEDLAVYEVSAGGARETRPAAKPQCAFRFHLRPGVRWHDGQPVTAADWLFTFDVIRNPQIKDAAHLRSYLTDMESARASEDGLTLEIRWARPYFLALRAVGDESLPPLPRHIFQPERYEGDPSALAEAFIRHEFNQKPIGCGAYRFEEWKGDRLSITRNPDYYMREAGLSCYAPERPYLDRIVWVVINNPLAALKEMQKGAVDLDEDIEPAQWVSAETNTPEFTSRFVRASHTGLLYTYIGWNMDRPWFQDARTRRALAMLVPAERIRQEIHFGLARRVTGPFFVEGPVYDPSIEPLPYDPRGARRLLREAGWLDRNGDGVLENEVEIEENGVKVRKTVDFRFEYLIHSARVYHEQIANIIKEEYAKAGIQVSIRKLEFATFAQVVQDRNFDACRFAWGTQMDVDPFQIWHSSQAVKGGSNFANFRNARADEIMAVAREEFDPLRRWALYREMAAILHEEQPCCFLFGFPELFIYSQKFRGVRLYPDQYALDFTEWWMDE